VLRSTSSARFPGRAAIRSFFAKAIETGAVIESGEGATKMLSLPMKGGHVGPALPLSDRAPISAKEIPKRVIELTLTMPFILFIPWRRCPPSNTFPKGTFVQSYEQWAILLFGTLTMAHRTVAKLPWLHAGTLVDWRRVEEGLDKSDLPVSYRTLIEQHSGSTVVNTPISSCFESLTADEKWEDDVELLRAILKEEGPRIDGFPAAARKSTVGSTLRITSSARFPDRAAIRSFFAKAIQTGAVIESGEGATKMLSLPMIGGHDGLDTAECSLCHTKSSASEMVPASNSEDFLCHPECHNWSLTDGDENHNTVQQVVAMLEMMAENDDIYVAENVLCKQLGLLYPDECNSQKVGALWVAEAVKAKDAISFNCSGIKSKLVCLPGQYENSLAPLPPENMDTTEEEKHVVCLLWESEGRVSRREVIDSLKGTFETMQTPFMRTKVFLNAQVNNRFFVAKGTSGQTVGLTKEQALVALQIDSESAEEPEESADGGSNKEATEPEEEQDEVSESTSIDSEDNVDLEAFVVRKASPSIAQAFAGNGAAINKELFVAGSAGGVVLRSNTKIHDTQALGEKARWSRLYDVKGQPATRNLFVCGYGIKTTKLQLQIAFSKHADVKGVMMKEGYAFVHTASRDSAILARDRLHGTTLNNQGVLKINFAKF